MNDLSVFLVDDQWAQNSGLLRAAFANTPMVRFASEGDEPQTGQRDGLVLVHSFRGQTLRQRTIVNDAAATVEELGRLEQGSRVSLVLLDMRFDSGSLDSRDRPAGMPGDESFGRHLAASIREAFPEIPIVFLSTYGQGEIGDESIAYLSKSDISDHSLAVCLLRHGQIGRAHV